MVCSACGLPLAYFSARPGAMCRAACVSPDCPENDTKPKPKPAESFERAGSRWAEDSAYKAMKDSLQAFLKDPKIRQEAPGLVSEAEKALAIDSRSILNTKDVERKNPGNACWADYRMCGKTISSIHASDYTRRSTTIKDKVKTETESRHPYIDLRFTDGTHVRLEPCDGGLQEDFGDGPVKIMDLPYMGVTEFSEYPKPEQK